MRVVTSERIPLPNHHSIFQGSCGGMHDRKKPEEERVVSHLRYVIDASESHICCKYFCPLMKMTAAL